MAARFAGRKGRPFVRAQKQCFREETHCCLCGGYVDQALANPRSSASRSVHHLTPPDVAPELANSRSNMRLAHYGCNARFGRGHLEGYGPKGGRPTRGTNKGRTLKRVPTPARGHTLTRTHSTADRDW